MGAGIMSLVEDLLSTLGKDATETAVVDLVQTYDLNDVYDDPPSRRYIGSSEKGVDLLLENGKVFDIQIYVQRTKTHAAFSEMLPFQVRKGMTVQDIHNLLGEPEVYDAVGSKYTILEGMAKLTVMYDKSNLISYLSIRKL
jgi:hypothetical protein